MAGAVKSALAFFGILFILVIILGFIFFSNPEQSVETSFSIWEWMKK